ncbi:MAG: hypothetical protein HZB29_02925 [Nitrospinae bacterium]|nr:hypothetical protein [Nitrospinota bacterium]
MGQMLHFGDLYHEDIDRRDESVAVLGLVFGMGCFAAGLFAIMIIGMALS